MSRFFSIALAIAALTATACRGEISQDPPVAILRNMYFQPKFVAQASNRFFEDKRNMRQPVAGTVAREFEISPTLGEGRTADEGGFVDAIPGAVVARVGDMEKLTLRGQGRYGIYCTPCHDGLGGGKGLVIRRAQNQAFQPPSFHEDRLRTMSDGQLFQTITYGANNMPPYGPQLPVDDRWAIVAYVRALQLSQANSNGAAQ
ncbi:MAG TPA: cytochrome c [Polyangiales bacterium]|nr:cytochrome c [Polyangiales bacterium]